MKKELIGSILILLLALMVLMPTVKASVQNYWWDSVYFVEGTGVHYPHPDTDYYDIDLYADWECKGSKLNHEQINYVTSFYILSGSVGLGATMGIAVGLALGGGAVGLAIGGMTGIALSFLLPAVITTYFLDERGCIWWWISTEFMDWLIVNQVELYILCVTNPTQAQNLILYAFLSYGYLRAGSVTFADFIGIGDPSPQLFTLTITRIGYGTTDPALGIHYYNYGEVVTTTATPSPYFEFCGWWLDGVRKGNIPVTFTMDSDHTLIAEFQYIPGLGGGGGTCPTLFVWNGTAYVEEGLLDIHAYSDVTIHHWIQNTLALENNVYKLQLRELDNNTSHIDQVKLYAVDYEGERHLCPLTYAYHNLLGKAKHTLRFDDDSRVDLKPTEMIDLKFALSTPYSETAYFIFEINGYNPKNPTPR